MNVNLYCQLLLVNIYIGVWKNKVRGYKLLVMDKIVNIYIKKL